MGVKSYRDLIVWQKSVDLSIQIFQLTKKFPKEELFGLSAQMRSAAFSIPSNIAEGYSRHTPREYYQFLRIAFGSGAELETQLLISYRTNIINKKDFNEISVVVNEVMRILNVLTSRVKSSR